MSVNKVGGRMGRIQIVLAEFPVPAINQSKSSTVVGLMTVTPAHGKLRGLPQKGWSRVGGSGREV